MGFKANIDIALSFSMLKMCSVRQQGRVKFRICLFYTQHTEQDGKLLEEVYFCHPYGIIRNTNDARSQPRQPRNLAQDRTRMLPQPVYPPVEESELDLGSDFYVSRPFKVVYERENHPVLETCCFRASIDIEKYEDIDLKCQVEMFFSPNSLSEEAATFKVIGKTSCKIRKLFDVSTYLPITFDQFEGVVIEGVYQAALVDFRYEKEETTANRNTPNPPNFLQYLKMATNGFTRSETRSFYKYYRELLEKQLFTIQERHYDLMRVLGLCSNLEEFRILRVNPNPKIESMIDHLGGYNSHQAMNPPTSRLQKYPFRAKQSLSTAAEQTNYLNRGILGPNEPFHRPVSVMAPDKFKQELSEEIMYDFLTVKAHLFKKWSQFLEFVNINLRAVTERYKNTYNSLVKQRLSSNVFSHKVNTPDWKKTVYKGSGRENILFAQAERKKIKKEEELWKQAFQVQSEGFFGNEANNVKIFEEIYQVNRTILSNKSQKNLLRQSLEGNRNGVQPFSLNPKNRRFHGSQVDEGMTGRKNSLQFSFNSFKMEEQLQGIQLMISSVKEGETENEDHFIVLVHGFQASRQDFVVFKNCLEIRFKTKVYISTCNQGRTDDDIQAQGKRLALQLQKFLNESTPSLNYRLSFIGHSMGGLIIRTALCYLENVEKHLYSYISLSTPHLGYLYEPETHIQAGLWFMNTWHKTTSIEQICVRDNENLRECFLYKLSRSRSLDRFRHVALVGSSQDKYIPYESSRVEQNQQIIQSISSQNGQVIYEMIENILGSIQCRQLSRLDVVFNIAQNNFDAMIGRTAHIRYLSDRQFIKLFCIVFDKFFK